MGSTTLSVSLLGILIPRCSLHSNHRSFLGILGNFIFNQRARLVLKVNVISVTKRFNSLSGYRLWMKVHVGRKKKKALENKK